MAKPQAKGKLVGIEPSALESRLALRIAGEGAGGGERLKRLEARRTGHGGMGGGKGIVSDSGNGVLTIRICGDMVQEADPWLEYLGYDQAAYADLVPAITAATGNALVRGVRFEIDTPGGEVEGFDALYAAMQGLVAVKPAVGVVKGQCCSMGQWALFALGLTETAAVDDSLLGSIGIMFAALDTSEAYKLAGVLPVIIASGAQKVFFGCEGLPITERQQGNIKSVMVDPTFARFKAEAIATRGLAADCPVFDARVLTAAEAKGFGLVGTIGTTSDIERWASDRLTALIQEQDTTMSKPATPPASTITGAAPDAAAVAAAAAAAAAASPAAAAVAVGAATLEELEAEFGDEPKFVIESLKGKLTLAAAAVGYAKLQKTQKAAAVADAAAARTELAGKAPAPVTPGNKRVNTGSATGAHGAASTTEPAEDTGVAADYEARVAELKGTLGTSKAQAQAIKEMPKSYGAWRKSKNLS